MTVISSSSSQHKQSVSTMNIARGIKVLIDGGRIAQLQVKERIQTFVFYGSSHVEGFTEQGRILTIEAYGLESPPDLNQEKLNNYLSQLSLHVTQVVSSDKYILRASVKGYGAGAGQSTPAPKPPARAKNPNLSVTDPLEQKRMQLEVEKGRRHQCASDAQRLYDVIAGRVRDDKGILTEVNQSLAEVMRLTQHLRDCNQKLANLSYLPFEDKPTNGSNLLGLALWGIKDQRKFETIASSLISAGADVNHYECHFIKDALNCVISYKNYRLFEFLLEKGAKIPDPIEKYLSLLPLEMFDKVSEKYFKNYNNKKLVYFSIKNGNGELAYFILDTAWGCNWFFSDKFASENLTCAELLAGEFMCKKENYTCLLKVMNRALEREYMEAPGIYIDIYLGQVKARAVERGNVLAKFVNLLSGLNVEVEAEKEWISLICRIGLAPQHLTIKYFEQSSTASQCWLHTVMEKHQSEDFEKILLRILNKILLNIPGDVEDKIIAAEKMEALKLILRKFLLEMHIILLFGVEDNQAKLLEQSLIDLLKDQIIHLLNKRTILNPQTKEFDTQIFTNSLNDSLAIWKANYYEKVRKMKQDEAIRWMQSAREEKIAKEARDQASAIARAQMEAARIQAEAQARDAEQRRALAAQQNHLLEDVLRSEQEQAAQLAQINYQIYMNS